MLTIDLAIHGKEKYNLPEDKKHLIFDSQTNRIFTKGCTRRVFGYFTATMYMKIFSVSDVVSIDTTLDVEKLKLTEQTIKKFEKELIPRIVECYRHLLDDILIIAEVRDDTGKKFEKEYTL